MSCQFSQAPLPMFCIPVSLHNKNVLLRCLINGIPHLVTEFYFLVIIVWRWGVRLYYCDVDRDCPRVDDHKPAGDWAKSHYSVHNVLVNKKFNDMLVFILFSTEENLVFFLCCSFRLISQGPRMFHLYLSTSCISYCSFPAALSSTATYNLSSTTYICCKSAVIQTLTTKSSKCCMQKVSLTACTILVMFSKMLAVITGFDRAGMLPLVSKLVS